jgi:radical SAM superfamily enzyme YgiQ (UPF0313 family)
MKDTAAIRRKFLSTEKGRISKRSSVLRIALGFPNSYEVGMSNLGFQTVYRLFNRMEQVICERFFMFDSSPYRGTRTLESNRNIKDFDLIAFSVPFELDYPHVLKLLKSSEIPLLSSQREKNAPFIIAGGVAPTLNPEVLAPFFDCLFIGEAEEMLTEFAQQYLNLFLRRISKEEILLELSQIEGVYVPKFYRVSYHRDGSVKEMNAERGVPSLIRKRSVNLEGWETYSPIVSPYAHFANTLLIEMGRGCGRGCRFCAAGYIYQPCRFYKRESILNQAERYTMDEESGLSTRHIGLIGSLISDHPELEGICEALHLSGFEIGTSSLRADMISPKLLKILVDSGMRTLTVAPEVGTERMWKIINKKIDREAVLKSAKLASEASFPNLKLYFIIGLPFEEEEDMKGIVDLVREVHRIYIKDHQQEPKQNKTRSGRRKLRLSINPFIPKPHTPFQWCGMNREEELKLKLDIIAEGVKDLKGVHFERKSTRQAILQGIFSLGNRKVGEGLLYTIEEESGFRQAWKKAGVDKDSIVFQPKKLNYLFPWDMIDIGITKSFLIKEYKKAEALATQ